MKIFEIGDIVKPRNYKGKKKEYHIITNVTSFVVDSEGFTEVEYEICKIYPISTRDDFDIVNHSEVEIVAYNNTRESNMILDLIKKELYIEGVTKPNWEYRIDFINKVEVKAPNKKKVVFDKNIHMRLMNDDTVEKKIAKYEERLDTHLKLLHIAITDGNLKDYDLHISQLQKIVKTLGELEYFSYK